MSTDSLSAAPADRKKVTTRTLRARKRKGEVVTMLTAYDFLTAQILDEAGIDAILVGDSLGMVVLGYPNTLAVTMEEMIHHCKAVARGARGALLIGDMPFLSYQVTVPDAVRNAGRFLQEGGMDAVKLEGGRERLEAIRGIISAGIPVMGHLGLTPQSVNQLGGFRPQGRSAVAAIRLMEDALLLQDVGCFSLVLESIPARLATMVSERLEIPTIGIGAGSGCDGQVLVTQDMLGLFANFAPKFVKRYANMRGQMSQIFSAYVSDVRARAFPSTEHSVEMPEEEWESLMARVTPGDPDEGS